MSVKSFLQKKRIIIGKFFLDKKTTENLTALPPKKILFMRQDGKIGDYIVSSAVFREIKLQYPNSQIGVVCTEKDIELLSKNPHIDTLHIVKKRSILDYIKQGLKISKEQYDVVIDPTIFVRNRDLLLLRLINAKNYVGYKKSSYGLFNFNLEGEYHFSELYQAALAKAGITYSNTSYDLPIDQNAEIEINTFLQENKIKNYIAINFYGAARVKKVNNENIKRYLDYLIKITGCKKIVLLTYPEVTENLKQFELAYENVFVHDTKNIFHTMSLIKNCDLLISTDTSTVHIASALNKKLIAIYKEDLIAFTHWKPKSQGETHILFYQENINELSPELIKAEWLNRG